MEAKESPRTVADDANWLWDMEEPERFVSLAITYPELLTYEEQETWKLLNESGLLKPARYRRGPDDLVELGSLRGDRAARVTRLLASVNAGSPVAFRTAGMA